MTARAHQQMPDTIPTECDPRWRSVVTRDAAANGAFYYSVTTTGVYCLPSCAARLARPENVRFHATCADARAAGFRPCKRCRPHRMAEIIHFVITPSSLGNVLIALSTHGIIALLLGDDTHELRDDLAHRFPAASLVEGGADLEAITAQVIAFVESPARELKVPLDIRGTAFQHSVWGVIRKISAGSTATYTQIAQQLGMPKAARAVAQACAANALAVIVPCHRVVRSDGALSGYRWGVHRKRALLDIEAAS
jgi:AraC family transcriptional regulator of adaptative response/methylated-DNA-[protein]-cysteine methyltransferase